MPDTLQCPSCASNRIRALRTPLSAIGGIRWLLCENCTWQFPHPEDMSALADFTEQDEIDALIYNPNSNTYTPREKP